MANILLSRPGEKLNNRQEAQFIDIMYQAYRSKFQKEMGDDPSTVKIILGLMVRMNLFPLEDRICAVDKETKDVLGIILISKFEGAGIVCMLKFVMRLVATIKPIKAIKLIIAFLKLDSLNSKSKKTCAADIYLIASKEDFRGQGIGTILMETGIKHIKESFIDENGKHKISLIVYKDNPAVSLYQRFGFEVVETFNTMSLTKVMGDNFHTHLLMHKTLEV